MKSNSIIQLLNRVLRIGVAAMVVTLGVQAQAKVIGWEGEGPAHRPTRAPSR